MSLYFPYSLLPSELKSPILRSISFKQYHEVYQVNRELKNSITTGIFSRKLNSLEIEFEVIPGLDSFTYNNGEVKAQWTFYEDITDTFSRDFLGDEDLQLQVHQAKWNGRLLSFELRNFSKNEVEVEFRKREPRMIYINSQNSDNRYSWRIAAGKCELFMFNLDWDPLQETIKDWATQVELFPHVELYFHWKDAQDKTIFMKYRCLRFDLKEWNETRIPTRDSSNRWRSWCQSWWWTWICAISNTGCHHL
ncbi:unnamed protein product, partial [Mesorhabditis belari]|uniref:F-box domain-containing protein n=1 Tax=Mesorhabditis belari TaxID=2138241 RepID=A0AAF3ET22_9BILA